MNDDGTQELRIEPLNDRITQLHNRPGMLVTSGDNDHNLLNMIPSIVTNLQKYKNKTINNLKDTKNSIDKYKIKKLN